MKEPKMVASDYFLTTQEKHVGNSYGQRFPSYDPYNTFWNIILWITVCRYQDILPKERERERERERNVEPHILWNILGKIGTKKEMLPLLKITVHDFFKYYLYLLLWLTNNKGTSCTQYLKPEIRSHLQSLLLLHSQLSHNSITLSRGFFIKISLISGQLSQPQLPSPGLWHHKLFIFFSAFVRFSLTWIFFQFYFKLKIWYKVFLKTWPYHTANSIFSGFMQQFEWSPQSVMWFLRTSWQWLLFSLFSPVTSSLIESHTSLYFIYYFLIPHRLLFLNSGLLHMLDSCLAYCHYIYLSSIHLCKL